MLQLTTEAADLIREIRSDNRQADDAMLRVSAEAAPGGANIELAFVAAAHDGDQVAETEGLAVCVAPELADALDDKVLDVAEAPTGKGLVIRAA